MRVSMELAEHGWIPDALMAAAIRKMLDARLADAAADLAGGAQEAFIAGLARAPIALATDAANAQHYEVPIAFFRAVLGPRMKYSSCLYPTGAETLQEAEDAMLAETCAHADLRDGQRVLELGCGWGSLTLWMAEQYPASRITAVSNSATQRAHIEAACRARGFDNVDVITQDMNDFEPDDTFDRIVSVEMFEHMRNWPVLFRRAARWLRADGRLFLHVFCHHTYCYPYTTRDDADWMARHFFTGGMMPCLDLPRRFPDNLVVEEQWRINGRHYAKTLTDWLHRMDHHRDQLMPIFADTYGPAHARRWFGRWRIFFLSCAEFFNHHGGEEWFIAHYRMKKAD